MLLPEEIILAKRRGNELSEAQIYAFVTGIKSGQVADSQIAAFAMAVCLQNMHFREISHLTQAMASTGDMLHWDDNELGGPVLDKHSSGGVGDKVSIALMPILVACGAFVPMVSGRSLGHTGGTLDKLEAIPGYQSDADHERFVSVVKRVGGAIIGANEQLAPADAKTYAVRDVTGTVDSVPLITASILSKKKAAGITRLIMDIKVGNGAFMRDLAEAEQLVEALLATAANINISMKALLTDMDQVLGTTVGNALETREAVDFLTANEQADPRLREITVELAGELLVMGGLATDLADARKQVSKVLASGEGPQRH